jgi:phenylalanine-specific permease
MIFHNLGQQRGGFSLNFVILVASLSVYNSGVYSNSRMLFGLSVQGNAPKFLARVSKRGVPVNSLLLSGISPRWWCCLTICCRRKRLAC